jgi:ATP-dependent RNA helicase SUPV3L1/SUV3
LWFAGARVARLVAGTSLLHPHVKLLLADLSAGARARVERRLLAHAKDLVLGLSAPLSLGAEASPPLRGLLYQLEQGLGTAPRRHVDKQLRALTEEERAALVHAQIYVGQDSVFSRVLLSTSQLVLRRALTRLVDPAVDRIKSALEQSALATGLPPLARESAFRLGFVPLGKWLVRCDVLELLRAAQRECPDEQELRTRVQLVLGSDEPTTAQILRLLGSAASKRAGPSASNATERAGAERKQS